MSLSLTTLEYMESPHQMAGNATILDFETYNDSNAIILNKTLFYPQGGGQPYDTGIIKGQNGSFTVDEVRFENGIVYHIGKLDGDIQAGEDVNIKINEKRRHLNSRLHTAGHLIDEAVNKLGYRWHATKGCHFPDQCSVEYESTLEESVDYAGLIKGAFDEMVDNGFETTQMFVPFEDLENICHFVLPNMPKDKPSRVAIVWGEKGIPCGGTHVKNISEVGFVTIKKVKAKKGIIKVSYDLE